LEHGQLEIERVRVRERDRDREREGYEVGELKRMGKLSRNPDLAY